MKISQAQKTQNRVRILESAVSAFSEMGFKNVTMKEIAKLSKVSEPALYKYFPTKESLVFAYFEQELSLSIAAVSTKESYLQLKFCEKLQALFEDLLERLQKQRPFVAEAFRSIFVSDLPSTHTETAKQRKLLIDFVQAQMKQSQTSGELQPSPLDQFLCHFVWDYYVGILYYWLQDKSPASVNTTQIIDKTLLLLQELLTTNILSRLIDIGQFLIRQHLLSGIAQFDFGSWNRGSRDDQR